MSAIHLPELLEVAFASDARSVRSLMSPWDKMDMSLPKPAGMGRSHSVQKSILGPWMAHGDHVKVIKAAKKKKKKKKKKKREKLMGKNMVESIRKEGW
jgi:hypothetical protein